MPPPHRRQKYRRRTWLITGKISLPANTFLNLFLVGIFLEMNCSLYPIHYTESSNTSSIHRLEGHNNCSHKVESQFMSCQKRHQTQAFPATHHQSPPGQNTGFIAKCDRLAFLFGLKSALHKTPAFHKQRKRKRGHKILVSLATKRKPYWIGFLFTHKNGHFCATSVTEWGCAALTMKLDRHISDRFLPLIVENEQLRQH